MQPKEPKVVNLNSRVQDCSKIFSNRAILFSSLPKENLNVIKERPYFIIVINVMLKRIV